MNYSFDFFDRLEYPHLILKKTDGEEVAEIGNYSGLKTDIRYNDVSELSFLVYKNVNESLYDLIKGKKYISTDIYGEFIIDNVQEYDDGIAKYKEVKCKSAEFELAYKRITLEPKTYKLYDIFTPSETLLGRIISFVPSWTVGTVDPLVSGSFRYFDVEDVDILSFLYSDAEEAYQCVFEFDYFDRKINVKALENVGYDTNIYLSLDNLIEQLDITENSDEIVTKLRVFGGNELDIRRVNPTGTDSLVNLEYFKDLEFMSTTLINKIDTYNSLYATKQSLYESYLLSYRNLNEELLILQGELGVLYNQLSAIITLRVERMAAGLSISQQYTDYQNKLAEIENKEAQITNKQTQINNYVDLLNGIIDDLSLENNFTSQELKTLDKLLIEYTYQNEAYMITDSMTENERLEQAQLLFEDGQEILERLSQPRFTFNISVADFLKEIKYEDFISKFGLTALMYIEKDENTVIETRLISYSYDWDNNSLDLEFTSKYRTNDPTYSYQELFKKSFSAGISVSFSKFQYKEWSQNNKDEVTQFINSALDASKNAIINAENQSIVFDENGLISKTVDGSGNESPEQLHMINNMLAFTRDSWNTASLAVGKINFDGVDVFGVVGETLVGNILAGNNLRISNTANQFLLDETGATLTNASFTLTTDNNKGRIILDPTQGIKIQNNATGSFTDGIYIGGTDGRIKANYIDILQNARIYGRLEAATGTFSGDLSAAGGTFSGNLSAVGGTFTGSLQGVDGTFTGTLNGNIINGAEIYGSYIEGSEINSGIFISEKDGSGFYTELFNNGYTIVRDDGIDDIRFQYGGAFIDSIGLAHTLYGRYGLKFVAGDFNDAFFNNFGRVVFNVTDEVRISNDARIYNNLVVDEDIDTRNLYANFINSRNLSISDGILSDTISTNEITIGGRLPTTSSTSQSIRFQVFGGNLEFSLNGGSFIKVANVNDLP